MYKKFLFLSFGLAISGFCSFDIVTNLREMSNKVCDNMSELVSKDGDSSFLCDIMKKNLEKVGYAVDCCNSEKHPTPNEIQERCSDYDKIRLSILWIQAKCLDIAFHHVSLEQYSKFMILADLLLSKDIDKDSKFYKQIRASFAISERNLINNIESLQQQLDDLSSSLGEFKFLTKRISAPLINTRDTENLTTTETE